MSQKAKTEIEKVILIDNREKKSGIPDLFKQNGWTVIFHNLYSGDYVYKDIVVERKSPQDFLLSLYNNRLFKEIAQMQEDPNNYNHIYLIIQGDFKDLLYLTKNRNIKQVQATLISCQIRGATPLFTGSQRQEDFYQFLSLLIEKHYDGKDRTPHSFTLRKIHSQSEYDITKNVLMGYKNIGEELAERLLKHFGSLKNFHNATLKQLMEVEGIGQMKAEQIYHLINFNWNDPLGDILDDILSDTTETNEEQTQKP